MYLEWRSLVFVQSSKLFLYVLFFENAFFALLKKPFCFCIVVVAPFAL